MPTDYLLTGGDVAEIIEQAHARITRQLGCRDYRRFLAVDMTVSSATGSLRVLNQYSGEPVITFSNANLLQAGISHKDPAMLGLIAADLSANEVLCFVFFLKTSSLRLLQSIRKHILNSGLHYMHDDGSGLSTGGAQSSHAQSPTLSERSSRGRLSSLFHKVLRRGSEHARTNEAAGSAAASAASSSPSSSPSPSASSTPPATASRPFRLTYINAVELPVASTREGKLQAAEQQLARSDLPSLNCAVELALSDRGVSLIDLSKLVFYRRHYPIRKVSCVSEGKREASRPHSRGDPPISARSCACWPLSRAIWC